MDSELHIDKNGKVSAYIGPDATQLFRAKATKMAISLHEKTGMIPTRGVTITKLFAIAGQYTGKKYKRGEHARAVADLTIWINTMASALPVVRA